MVSADAKISKSPIKVYQEVLSGERKTFPKGFFRSETAKEDAKAIIKYVLEQELGWSIEEIPKNITKQTFIDMKLIGMLNTLYSNQIYKALDDVYPGKWKRWELKYTTRGCITTDKDADEVIKWVIDTKMDGSIERAKRELTYHYLISLGLRTVADICLKKPIADILNRIYNAEYKAYDFRKLPSGYWKKEGIIEKGLRDLIRDSFNSDKLEAYNEITVQMLVDKGLQGIYKECKSDILEVKRRILALDMSKTVEGNEDNV